MVIHVLHRYGFRLAGLIGNHHTGEAFRDRVPRFAAATGTRLLADVPFDPQVQKAEERRMTICDFRPRGRTAKVVAELAARLLEVGDPPPPRPLDEEAFEAFVERTARKRARR